MKEHERIVKIARAEVGNGEWPHGSNDGPHVEKYLGAEYKPGREWCAGFVSWCLEQAGFLAPMQGRARRGARALVRWVAAHGEWAFAPHNVKVLKERLGAGFPVYLLPGDVICWKRSRFGWQCHVALVAEYSPEDGTMVVIEGNAKGHVRRAILTSYEWPRRFRGLYGIARPRAA